jgi:hypothetical protein
VGAFVVVAAGAFVVMTALVFSETVRVCPEAVLATTSVITPVPTTAATASVWFTRVRRRRAASRLACARVRMLGVLRRGQPICRWWG